jgi:D-xylose transport system substrate-binding protein
VRGEEIAAPMQVDGIPATLLDPVPVTVHDILNTVVADGFWTVDDICTPAYEAACREAGLLPPAV